MALIKLNPVHKPRLPPILAEKKNFFWSIMKSADSQLLANLGIKKTAENVLKFFFSNLLVFFSYFITQFTKRTFVRHKNTQDILIFYMDQLFMLVTNPNIFLRSSQHFWFYFNFLIFFKIFYLYFLCLLSKCCKLHQKSVNHATS